MSNQSMKSQFLGSLRSKQTGVRIFSLVLFVSVIAFVLYHGTKTPVMLTADGETTKIYTHATTVDELLTAQNIDYTNYDKVSPSLSTSIDIPLSILVLSEGDTLS